MQQYLTIFLRAQFTLFYRFGYTFIPKCQLLEFEGEINEASKKGLLELFAKTTPFEYDEEYLILHLEKSNIEEGEVFKFQIQDLVKIYPLSEQAKVSIESRIDQRIRLEPPLFANILPKVEQAIELQELHKAIEALWRICKIEDDLSKYLDDIGLENIYKGIACRKNGTKASQIKEGNYWEYVIAYDRYEYYPNTTLGYFYDAGQIFAFTKGSSSFERSSLHNLLEGILNANSGIKFKDLTSLLETSEGAKGYVSQTTSENQIRYIITPLYLMLKADIRKKEEIQDTILLQYLPSLKEHGNSFNYALVLLGAFFGFKKFYDVYYDKLNLRFYHQKTKPNDVKTGTNNIVSDFDPNESGEAAPPPISVLEDAALMPEKGAKSSKKLGKMKPGKTEVAEPVNDSNATVNAANPALVQEEISVELPENTVVVPSNQDDASDRVEQYKAVILELLSQYSEVKLTVIAAKIKEQVGNEVNNTVIKNVIKTISNAEIIPKKKPECARLVNQPINDLFSQQET